MNIKIKTFIVYSGSDFDVQMVNKANENIYRFGYIKSISGGSYPYETIMLVKGKNEKRNNRK